VVTDSQNTQKIFGDPRFGRREYIEHTTLGTARGRRNGTSWRFDWTAPSTNVGDVAFFGSGNAADGDGSEGGDKIYNPTPNPLARTKGQFTFTNVAAAANVAAGVGRGVAVGDFDKDGRADLFVAADGQYLLYRNNGDGTFTDVAESAGITAGDAQGRAAAWGDYNGDGNLDLYVVNAGADRLYRNNGDGTFSDVSADAGISDEAVGYAAVWVDVNGDGQMDLYVVNDGQDALYLNQMGMLSQTDPTMSGTAESAAGRAVAVGDYNGDGKPDLFVANEGSYLLYRNDGDGHFTDVSAQAGIHANGAAGRAAAWLDFNGDGKPDVLVINEGDTALYANSGNGTFSNIVSGVGLVNVAGGRAVAVDDYDKDGDMDVFVANEGQDFLYRNNGNGTFNEVATFSGMTDTAAGRAAAWLDVNNDGSPDLVVVNATGSSFLYRNPGRSGAATMSMARQTINQVGYGALGFCLFVATVSTILLTKAS
jgi:hypothetical protein